MKKINPQDLDEDNEIFRKPKSKQKLLKFPKDMPSREAARVESRINRRKERLAKQESNYE